MSFLEQNLSVLPRDPKAHNQKFVDRLRVYAPQASTADIVVYETHAQDLTILYQDAIPLHRLEGAKQEAEQLVDTHVCYARHSINLLFGLGLGYTLEATVNALKAKRSKAQVIVYESNLDLLHFTLDNVGLSHVLAYENLLIFTEPEALWHYVETHLVQGEGMGILMTEGTLKAFSPILVPVIEKLKIHAENAVRNAKVLQNRSRLWANTFLQNSVYFPETHSVHHLQESMEGKTVVLCGAGPSLNDALPQLHAVRHKIVICAVTGAVKALQQHGLTADFVFGMDYYGPEKQMEGLEDPLKDCHIITGPSADPFMMTQACKSRWMAALKYNDQYTLFLNALFNEEMNAYNPGGTVSFFMLLICVDLGFKNIILAGQDMALRGTQVYATGETLEIEGEALVSKALNNRSSQLCYVDDWEGNPLMTQDDYKHFKYHYDTIRSKIKMVLPHVEIYNCSVGGARILGMENLPIQELLPRLDLGYGAPVDEIVMRQFKYAEKQSTAREKAERLYDALERLDSHAQGTLNKAEKAVKALEQLKILKSSSWVEASERYAEAFNEFSEALEAHNFLQDAFYHEQLMVYQAYNDFAEEERDVRENFDVDLKYLNTMVKLLKTSIVPPLQSTLKNLKDRYTLGASPVLTFSVNADW